MAKIFSHLLIFVAFSCLTTRPALAQSPGPCHSDLVEAKNLTRAEKYDSALTLINTCLKEKQPTVLERAEAYKLLGVVRVALKDTKRARAAFFEMLQLQPLASLDSSETPETVKVFEQARVDFFSANESQHGTRNWPWIIVAGAVVATVGALLFLQ
ncbi:MAG: hypothetical protein ACE5G1_02070 [bacterium]